MRIDLLAPPYSGHLHPVLAIARELSAQFEVRVVSTPSAQARIQACGFKSACLLSVDDETLLAQIANPPHAVRSNPWRMNRQLSAALQLMARFKLALHALYDIEQPDLLIADFTLAPAGLVAQERGIPWWTSLPSPCVLETRDGPPAYLGGMLPVTHGAARAYQSLARQAVRGFKRGVFRLHRRAIQDLGLTTLYRPDGSERIYSATCVLALGVEQLEFPRCWPAALRFVGPKLFTPPFIGPEPPFVAGQQHVLVTAGTHLHWLKDRLATATRALARAMPQVQFHFSDGDATAEHADTQANFSRLAYVNYEQAVPRYDLVVHHGGAGILYYCLLHAVPAVVFPVDYDQFDHAARLQQARAAIWLRDLRDLEKAVGQGLHGGEPFSGLAGLQTAIHAAWQNEGLCAIVSELTLAVP